MANCPPIPRIIAALKRAGRSDRKPVLRALEAWKKNCYPSDIPGPPPTWAEWGELTALLVRWGDLYGPPNIDTGPLKRFIRMAGLRHEADSGSSSVCRPSDTELGSAVLEAVSACDRLSAWLRSGGLADAAEVDDAKDAGKGPAQTKQRPRKPPVILSLGNRQYRIGAHAPCTVQDAEDRVLQAFVGRPTMDTRALKCLAPEILDPGKVLRTLCIRYDSRFAPAITLPGRKGKGGYHVAVKARPVSGR
jgi:hypothetical protein